MRLPLHAICLVVLASFSPLASFGAELAELTQLIDRRIDERLAAENVQPTASVDAAGFLRRVTLDLAGRIPSQQELEDYLAANPEHRKPELVQRLMDATSFAKVGELETPGMYTWDPKARRHSTGGIRALRFSPDSQFLAVGGVGRIGNIDHLDGPARLEVFRLPAAERTLELEDNKKKGLIEQIAWSPDAKWILTAGGDHNGFITIYDAESGELLHQDRQDGHIHALAYNQDFSNIYTASHRRVARWTMA